MGHATQQFWVLRDAATRAKPETMQRNGLIDVFLGFGLAMRISLTLSGFLATAIAFVAGPACAQNLPWCATLDTDGSQDCSYYTEQQCREEISGIGGMCSFNPSAATPTLAPTGPQPGAGSGAPLQLDPGTPPGLGTYADPGPPPN
jgi:Protein of unknown function (DUF3551)